MRYIEQPPGIVPVDNENSTVLMKSEMAKNPSTDNSADYRVVFDANPNAIFILDTQGRILNANLSAVQRYGYSLEELRQMSAADLAAPDLRSEVLPQLQQSLKTAGQLEWRHRHKDGSELPVEIHSHPIVYHGELSILSSARDISQRKQSQAALGKSKELLQSIVENAPVRIFWKDRDLRYLGCNTEFAQDAGYSGPNELTGKTDFEMSWKDQAELYRADDKAVMESGKPKLAYEEPQTTPQGKQIWLSTSKVPLLDENNQTIGILGIYQDITARKLVETLRNGQQQILEMIATGTPLPETLEALVRIIEAQSYGMLGSILLLDEDGVRVRHGAAPSLPAEFIAAIDGEAIGPAAGSCGTAAYRKKAVFVEDIATDPLWEKYKAAALPHGLHACWSTPIFDARQQVLGTFAMYYRHPGLPHPEHLELIDTTTHLAAIAISNRKAAEALRISEKSLRESQLIAGLGTYVMDFRAGLWESSDILDRLFGIGADYARTREGWYALIHPDDRARVEDYLKHAIATQSASVDTELRIVCQDSGVERWVHGMGKLEFDTEGLPLKLQGTFQDITVSKQAEAELRKLTLAVEQSPNSIVITDTDANIEYVNENFVKLTGYSRDEVIGKNPRILQSGRTSKAIYRDMWAHLARGEAWQGELYNKRKDGSEYIESVQISPVRQADGQISHYLAIKENISEKKNAEARIERLAHFDQLTGLPNRSLMNDRFKYALSLAQRGREPLAVMFLDLDRFKNINDTLGHSIGDRLLMEVGRRIKSTLREEDTVSRLGGDEFMLILHATDADGAAYVANKLLEAVSQPCLIEEYELSSTASIGIAIYPDDGEDFETLSRNADAAMYRVKQGGRNNFRFYTAEMQTHSARTLQLANALRHALERNELQLHYQPQLSIQDGHIIGAEALLRWQHPELGIISPAEFIPIAEDSGQIIPIGEWVLRTAAKQLKDWMDSGLPPMVMAVNLSSVQFRQANIVELVSCILDEVGLPHQYLELELTEAVAMDDPLAAIEVMDRLYAIGIRMSIDDFGTGYSSLSYLKKFKVYKLKIDQSFVRDITDDPDDKAIVSAIINMASSLGIRTIAEGVESAGQLAFLRLQGCDEVQGYYFSKPLTAEQFEAFIKTG